MNFEKSIHNKHIIELKKSFDNLSYSSLIENTEIKSIREIPLKTGYTELIHSGEISISGIKFKLCTFENVDFSDYKFDNCSFEQCIFVNCRLGGAVFFFCKFCDSFFKNCNTEETIISRYSKNMSSYNLSELRISKCMLSNCKFDNISCMGYFRDSYLYGISFIQCNLRYTSICDCVLIYCNIELCNLFNCDLSSEFMLSDIKSNNVNCQTTITDHNLIWKDWLSAAITYEQAYKLFRAASEYELASEYYQTFRLCERKYEKGIRKIFSYLEYFFWGYGEKPFHVLASGMLIILLYSILYYHTGLTIGNDKLNLLDSIYFSVVTFTTLGYGDILPSSVFSKLLVMSEVIIGVIFIAIGTASIYKKITKS